MAISASDRAEVRRAACQSCRAGQEGPEVGFASPKAICVDSRCPSGKDGSAKRRDGVERGSGGATKHGFIIVKERPELTGVIGR